MTQRQADVVPSVQQAFLAERVDLEWQLFAVRLHHALPRQIDGQLVSGKRRDFGEEAFHLRLGQHQRQQSVLEAVGEKDVGERRRDDRAEAVIVERPRRMLAR